MFPTYQVLKVAKALSKSKGVSKVIPTSDVCRPLCFLSRFGMAREEAVGAFSIQASLFERLFLKYSRSTVSLSLCDLSDTIVSLSR